MEQQALTINLDYPFQTLLPAKQLIVDITRELEDHNIISTISDRISLDFGSFSIVITSETPCRAILEILRPIFEQTNIEVEAKITLKFGEGNFIDDVPLAMGTNCQKADKKVFEIAADRLRKNTPPKHGFLLISYTKNGQEVDLFTEKGTPKQKELIDMYMLLASNLM
ncbi:hypothetical protein [Aureispira sp. CCB-QB1]|uniref:hypothetical protein n=1 Tax=Aureispira sp. CCB-QB1 TaxID=1313421 RepID=UPI0006972C5F|nr:hypothetical protein [Aureispira sp. CCB-QB1]